MSADAAPPPGANPGGWGMDRATVAARLRAVKARTARGDTARQIADDLGLTTRTVYAYRRRLRDMPPAVSAPPDAEQVRRAIDLYAGGLSLRQTATETGLTKGAVYWILSQRGLVRPRGEAERVAYPEPGHGTRAHYLRGCGCDGCAEANLAYQRAWRARRREAR